MESLMDSKVRRELVLQMSSVSNVIPEAVGSGNSRPWDEWKWRIFGMA